MDEKISYTIGEVVEITGLTHRTLRHYEEYFNLNIHRDKSGTRIYTQEDIEILEIIVDLKKKSMKLPGIRTILIEKNIIPEQEQKEIVLIDPKALEAKEFLVTEIKNSLKEAISTNPEILSIIDSYKDIKESNEFLLEENKQLKEMLDKMNDSLKNLEDTTKSVKESLSTPWYKKFLK